MTDLATRDPTACPTCGFPNGEPGYLRSDFPPSHPKFGHLIPCPDCRDGTLSERLKAASQLQGWLKDATLGNYKNHNGNRAACEAARTFAGNPKGWLTYWGSYGPGKTHLLAAVVNSCTQHRIAAVYYTLPDLLDKLRGSYGVDGFSGLFDKLVAVRVLALDEVDKVRLTDWAIEKVYQLIDARYRELDNLGTLFAMNVEPDPVMEDVMAYLFSRMHDHRNKVIEVGGGDARPVVMS
jgi:DNA replication protein DnaC